MLASGASLIPGADVALSQTQFPSAPVKIVVGFPAGSAPDTLARLLADRLQPALGQPVVIETLLGAGGNIAADRVAKAPADGQTLLMAGNAALVVNQSLYERLPFDPAKDLVPISQVAITPNVLVVHPDVPAKSVAELVALAKAKPDELTYAHVGVGTSLHLASELFKQVAGIAIRPVAYRGGNTLQPDLLAGRINLCFCNIATTLPLVREGKLRALAVTSLKPSPVASDLPTMDASGFPGFQADAWFGLMAPAGTSASVIATLHRETAKALSEAGMRKTLLELGMVPVGNSPEEFADVIKSERPYWHKLVETLGLKLQ
jgi:tripartite-type tricarboxylate transporter receptor subunit TctC